jgi:hypothetical protein
VFAAYLDPTPLMLALVVVQFGLYWLFLALARPHKPKTFGRVRTMLGRPISLAVVRLFEPKYHKLLESQITDIRGRYGFLVRKGEYEITVEKKGYETWKGTVSVDAAGQAAVTQDVRLKKA